MAQMTVTTTDGVTYTSKVMAGDEFTDEKFQRVLKEILGGEGKRNFYMVDQVDVFRRFNPDNITNVGFVGLTNDQMAALDEA